MPNPTKRDPRDFPSVQLSTHGGASAEVLLHGAHAISWKPANRSSEHLFVSDRARYESGSAIRGGVPIIFPQFADRGPLTKHGFARVQPWRLLSEGRNDDGSATALLELSANPDTRSLWPHDFTAHYRVTLSDEQLDMQLQITNTGTTDFQFTAALHTYLAVGDIGATHLHGLKGSAFQERGTEGMTPEHQDDLIFTGALDRVYHKTGSPLTLTSPIQQTLLHAEGFQDTVVWNPWAEGCAGMDDMREDDYRGMLCVEAARVLEPIRLCSGESWTGRQTLIADR